MNLIMSRMGVKSMQIWKEKPSKRTIDGDGNDLGQSVAVGTLEGRDLAEGLDAAVLLRLVESSSRVRLSLDKLQLDVVSLSGNEDGDGASVLLFIIMLAAGFR